MTDNEIIELYWQRSEEAIFYTMREYGGYLIKLTLNILHIREEAEECVNESYVPLEFFNEFLNDTLVEGTTITVTPSICEINAQDMGR